MPEMDPNITLADLLEYAHRVLEQEDGDNDESGDARLMAERFLDLDGWLGGGGFLPEPWSRT